MADNKCRKPVDSTSCGSRNFGKGMAGRKQCMQARGRLLQMQQTTLCFKKKSGHPFCFCYNFVSRDQILLILGCLGAKEICNRKMLTDLKEIAGALR